MDTLETYEASRRNASVDDRPLGDLVKALSADTLHLVKQEATLFRVETEQKIAKAQREVMVLGAGSLIAHTGVLALAAAMILALSEAIAPWAAALIVGLAFAIGGFAALMIAKKRLAETDLAPRHTARSVKNDVRTVQEAIG
jgi:uncharacterized membrane protein YqjE